MSNSPGLSESELAVIVDHVEPMLHGVEKRLRNLPSRDSADTGNYVKNQRRYLMNARGALKWVIGVAKQRARGAGNVNRSPV